MRQLNLTGEDVFGKDKNESPLVNDPVTDSHNSESILNEVKIELPPPNTKISLSDKLNQDENTIIALQKIQEMQALSEKSDRYLTNPEIKALSHLLGSVKKSDLEAIIEIYNIAKDIYKEVDKTADENILEETIKDLSQNSDDIRKALGRDRERPTSYFYDPLTVSNNKLKPSIDGLPMPYSPIIKEKSNSLYDGSNSMDTQSIPYLQAFHREFAKLPYYYPISNFQRLSSYVHQPYPIGVSTPYISAETKRPCQKKEHLSPWNNILIKQPIETPKKETKPQEPVFLPFPFAYVHHYNASKTANSYLKENPWTNADFYTQPQKNVPSYVGAAYIAQIPNAVLINPNLKKEIQDLEQKPIEQNKKVTKPETPVQSNILDDLTKNKPKKNLEWETDDLPTSVLNEIRGNVASKSKLFPFPLRKKVKLERVGKVIKIEEHSRSKRETSEEMPTEVYEGYDVYLEKNT